MVHFKRGWWFSATSARGFRERRSWFSRDAGRRARAVAAADEDVLAGALHTAWKLRVERNAKSARNSSTGRKKRNSAARD